MADKELLEQLLATRRRTNTRMMNYMRDYRTRLANKTSAPWSLDQHQQFGRTMKQMIVALTDGWVTATNERGKKGVVARRFDRALKAVEALRCDLDNLHQMDNPEEFTTDTYYGQDADARAPQEQNDE